MTLKDFMAAYIPELFNEAEFTQDVLNQAVSLLLYSNSATIVECNGVDCIVIKGFAVTTKGLVKLKPIHNFKHILLPSNESFLVSRTACLMDKLGVLENINESIDMYNFLRCFSCVRFNGLNHPTESSC